MCGIAGIVGPVTRENREAVERMTRALDHRGPDDRNILELDGCILGHTRLSIVDIEGGSQPMMLHRRNGNVAVAFNGEIYGYKSLRSQYHDFTFQTHSDTEVLLAAYQTHGQRMLDHIPGMFAFSIWDENRKQLFCARDRFGEKPLYYARGRNGEFVFCSEIPALLASGLIDVSIDRNALSHYLRFLYTAGERTIFREIRALLPAHSLAVSNGEVDIRRYWSSPSLQPDISLDDAAEEFRHLMQSAVDRQLVADVPVGVFLSGGLDSSSIAMLAARTTPHIRSFSFEFPGDLSELHYAIAAAEKSGTDHTVMSADDIDIADLLPSIVEAYGEPFADSSCVPMYALCREAAKHTKVALTGDGGDELLGGYTWYKTLYWMREFADIGPAKAFMLRVVSRAMRVFQCQGHAQAEERNVGAIYARRFASITDAHRHQVSFFSRDETQSLGLTNDDSVDFPGGNSLDHAMLADVKTYMADDILKKVDRASMAHGLELRAPFLDRDVATFCLSLPYRLKMDAKTDKILLRRTFRHELPRSILHREKLGFGGPVAQWLKMPRMRELVSDVLFAKSAAINDHLDLTRFRSRFDRTRSMQVWALLYFGLWLQMPSVSQSLRPQDRPTQHAA